MKIKIKTALAALTIGILFSACKKDNNTTITEPAVVYYDQQDQMGRPAINTVFNPLAADKEMFNITAPSAMNAAFQSKFQARLMALNPGYTTNALGQNAGAFTGLLATDVLNVSTGGTTTFFDGNAANTLSGRKLTDDVIDVELLLVFGGPSGTSNPGLTSDHVNGNDKPFLSTFPYLASPF
jgi:hypothetical protein